MILPPVSYAPGSATVTVQDIDGLRTMDDCQAKTPSFYVLVGFEHF